MDKVVLPMLSTDKLKEKLRNLTIGKKYITDFITRQPLDELFRNEEIEKLLEYHPTRERMSNIEHLVVRIRKPFNRRSLFVKQLHCEEELNPSYVLCIKSLFNKFDVKTNDIDDVKAGFRSAVFNNHRNSFFYSNTTNNTGECAECHQVTDVCVDHYLNPFKNILNVFLCTKGVNMLDIKVEKNENNLIVLCDETLKNEWITYHDSVVTYRLLCTSCNGSLGSYGY